MKKYSTDLFNYLSENPSLPLPERLQMARMVTVAIKECHPIGYRPDQACQRVRHWDIKPSNIFIEMKNGTWDGKTLVLGDFGIADQIFGPI